MQVLTAAAAVEAELNAMPPNTQMPQTATPEGGPTRSGVYKVGNGVTPPVPTHRQEPKYSEQARKAKYQGTVVLYVEVDPTGHPRNIRVIRSLGLGLDEKAVEAVNKWRFKPGTKDGKPVTVAATIEVNFRLM
jgi:TonB family protein